MIPRYLDPKNDFAFKKIFGHHADLLKSFLNAILPLPEDCIIEHLTYLTPESVPDIDGFKYTIVDVRCYDNHGRHFIVEMQMQKVKYFVQRMLYTTADTYTHQLKSGQGYGHLSPVYGLALINDNFTKEEEWYHHYQMTDKKNRTLDDIQLVLIELPKFKPTSVPFKRLTALWLRFFREIDEETRTVDQSLLAEAPIKQALDLLEASSFSESELLAYNKVIDSIRTGSALMEGKIEEAEAKGKAKGKAEGKAEMARNLHQMGMGIEQIAQAAQLSEKEIQKFLEINDTSS